MSDGSARTMDSRDWLLRDLPAACFSVAFTLNRIALADLPPLTIVLGRVALGESDFSLGLWVRGVRLPAGWRHWRDVLVVGALGNALPFALTVFGQSRISVGLAAIPVATTPFCTLLAAHLLTDDEQLSPDRL